MSDAAKSEKFTKKKKWYYWYPTLINYLYTTPGRDGVYLWYAWRECYQPNMLTIPSFLYTYTNTYQLVEEAFIIDSEKFHILLMKSTSGND